jgi:carboxymethylenebutenolidase
MIIKNEIVDLASGPSRMRTYVYRPEKAGRYPAILFYSEIFQQTGPILRAARFMAGHGYLVLVPEIFHELNPIGTVLGYDDAGRDKGNADKIAKPLSSHDRDTAALIEYLSTNPYYSGKVGTMGFCIGGHLSFRAALHPEIKAAACFYATDIHSGTIPAGTSKPSAERAGEIRGECLMIWGKQDPHILAEGRRVVYDLMSKAALNFTWHEFNGQHAFMRDEGERYDAELQRLGYQLSLALFERNLKN